jgi:hypothetical protein
MCIGRRTDHDGVDIRAFDGCVKIFFRLRNSQALGAVTRHGLVGIGYHQQPGPRDPAAQVLGVQFANPARPDEANIYYTLHHNFIRCHMLAGRKVFANPCQNQLPFQRWIVDPPVRGRVPGSTAIEFD